MRYNNQPLHILDFNNLPNFITFVVRVTSFLVLFVLTSISISSAQRAVVYKPLCDSLTLTPVSPERANILNKVFINSNAFDWTDAKNNCEDRANAICLILDQWGIDNCKAWIYRGKKVKYGNKKGTLSAWNYHVAACILVRNKNIVDSIIIDPLISKQLINVNTWAEIISVKPTNIYFLTTNKKYQHHKLSLDPKWKMAENNFEKTIEGLTRYSGATFFHRLRTKKYLKRRYYNVNKEFYRLYNSTFDEILSRLNKTE